jgi:hypothetical protein
MARTFVVVPHELGPEHCGDTARVEVFLDAHEGKFDVVRFPAHSVPAVDLRRRAKAGPGHPLVAVVDDDETIVAHWVEPNDIQLEDALASVLAG